MLVGKKDLEIVLKEELLELQSLQGPYFLKTKEATEEILQQLKILDKFKNIQPIILTDKGTDKNFMKDSIPDDKMLNNWLSVENLQTCKAIIVDNFVVIEDIDGRRKSNTEIKLVITHKADRQHLHILPDSYFIFIDGYGEVVSGSNKISISPGDRFQVPKHALHGFNICTDNKNEQGSISGLQKNIRERLEIFSCEYPQIDKDNNLIFISIQNPPLANEEVLDYVDHAFLVDNKNKTISDLRPLLDDGSISSVPMTYEDITR